MSLSANVCVWFEETLGSTSHDKGKHIHEHGGAVTASRGTEGHAVSEVTVGDRQLRGA